MGYVVAIEAIHVLSEFATRILLYRMIPLDYRDATKKSLVINFSSEPQ